MSHTHLLSGKCVFGTHASHASHTHTFIDSVFSLPHKLHKRICWYSVLSVYLFTVVVFFKIKYGPAKSPFFQFFCKYLKSQDRLLKNSLSSVVE